MNNMSSNKKDMKTKISDDLILVCAIKNEIALRRPTSIGLHARIVRKLKRGEEVKINKVIFDNNKDILKEVK